MPSLDNFTITWHAVEEAVSSLVPRINPLNIQKVVGIGRGGLIPAAMIAYQLDSKPELGSIYTSSYEGKKQKEVQIDWDPDYKFLNTEDTLIVDDLYDTGNTYKLLHERLSLPYYAFLFLKADGWGRGDVDPSLLIGTAIPQDCWATFPWERWSERKGVVGFAPPSGPGINVGEGLASRPTIPLEVGTIVGEVPLPASSEQSVIDRLCEVHPDSPQPGATQDKYVRQALFQLEARAEARVRQIAREEVLDVINDIRGIRRR